MANEGKGTMLEAERTTGRHSGYAKVTESITFQGEPWMKEVVRRMAVTTKRSAAEIYREALEHDGLAAVAGYAQALAEYEAAEQARAAGVVSELFESAA